MGDDGRECLFVGCKVLSFARILCFIDMGEEGEGVFVVAEFTTSCLGGRRSAGFPPALASSFFSRYADGHIWSSLKMEHEQGFTRRGSLWERDECLSRFGLLNPEVSGSSILASLAVGFIIAHS